MFFFFESQVVKTHGRASSKKRAATTSRAAASKLQKRSTNQETTPPSSTMPSPMASPVRIEATTIVPLVVPKGIGQKACAVKPTVNLSQTTSSKTLPSQPNSPPPKSPLFLPTKKTTSPSVATSGVVGPKSKQSVHASSPVAKAYSLWQSKPSPSCSEKKGKAMASPPRYSTESAYSHWFFKFENERLSEKYITRSFIAERTIKLESFRALGVQKLIEDKG